VDDPGIEISALQSIPFFAELDPEDLSGIFGVGAPVSFDADQVIVEEGDAGDAMFVVVGGQARVEVGGRFHLLGPGDFFGEMALIAPGRRMATVKAVEPVSALRIPAADFQSFLLNHPSVALAMLKAIVLRLREVEQRIDAWMA
jgi:CRP/FNR family transcriptional regulator, cyclic AMP receptor protein